MIFPSAFNFWPCRLCRAQPTAPSPRYRILESLVEVLAPEQVHAATKRGPTPRPVGQTGRMLSRRSLGGPAGTAAHRAKTVRRRDRTSTETRVVLRRTLQVQYTLPDRGTERTSNNLLVRNRATRISERRKLNHVALRQRTVSGRRREHSSTRQLSTPHRTSAM